VPQPGVLDANHFVTGPLGANWMFRIHQVQHCTASRRSMELELFWYEEEQWITQREDDQSQPAWQKHITPFEPQNRCSFESSPGARNEVRKEIWISYSSPWRPVAMVLESFARIVSRNIVKREREMKIHKHYGKTDRGDWKRGCNANEKVSISLSDLFPNSSTDEDWGNSK